MDAHFIHPQEYDELPELTDEMFDHATYKVKGIVQQPPRRRGQQKAPKKIPLHLRLPAEVIAYFKADGRGWQTRIGVVLQQWVSAHVH